MPKTKNIHQINFSHSDIATVAEHVHCNSITQGISNIEASRRLKKHGSNAISLKKSSTILQTIYEPFASWFVLILIFSAGISVAIGKKLEASVVMVIVFINAIIYYFQHYTTAKVLKSLNAQDKRKAWVRRSGKKISISVEDIVVGDIVLLSEGMKVPADGRVISSSSLQVDESILTGESNPQSKTTETLGINLPIYKQANMVFRSTIVNSGEGEMLVVATGMQTEFGRIAKLSKPNVTKSPLQKKIDDLTARLILVVLCIAIITFVLKLLSGSDFLESLRFILSLSVSAIPEGLPIAVVIVMVFGVSKMAKRNALVRNITAIETLGQTTLIATDKTGTITKNKLTVSQTYTPSSKTDIATVAFKSAGNSNKTEPIDILFLRYFKDKAKPKGRQIAIIPFVQELRISGSTWKYQDKTTVYIKGAIEQVLAACKLTTHARTQLHAVAEDYAKQGLRVLALAAKQTNLTKLGKKDLHGFSFAGFVAFGDELRPRVLQAVQNAHSAGIDIVLLTGDHTHTAGFFAQKSGISKTAVAIHGDKLAHMSSAHLRELIKNHKAIGRVLPEIKYKILQAFSKTHITAMTGDGINDVPALRKANVGIAVGSANDAAKEASDVIILDNNFATIIDAVEQGRVTLSNVAKMLSYVLATNLGEVITVVGALLLGVPLPITALQILWINVVTDSFTMIPIGLESAEKNVLLEKPSSPSDPLLDRNRLMRVFVTAIVMASLTLAVYLYFLPGGLGSAQAMAFTTLVIAQWANALNARSDNKSFVSGILRPNWWLVCGISIAVILQSLAIWGPLRNILGTQSLNTTQILTGALVFIVILLAGDVIKKLLPLQKN